MASFEGEFYDAILFFSLDSWCVQAHKCKEGKTGSAKYESHLELQISYDIPQTMTMMPRDKAKRSETILKTEAVVYTLPLARTESSDKSIYSSLVISIFLH